MSRILRITIALTAVYAVAFPAVADAGGYFGQRTPARVLAKGDVDMAGHFGLFQNALVVFGEARTGLMPNGDGGVRLGVVDFENGGGSGLIIGGDFKYNVLNERAGDPFEMAIAPEFSFLDNGGSVFSLGFSAIASVDLFTARDRRFTPYGRVQLRLDHFSSGSNGSNNLGLPAWADGSGDVAARGRNDSEFEIAASFGASFEMSDLMELRGEFILDNDSGMLFGLNFRI